MANGTVTKRAGIVARVSSEEQAQDDRVSLAHQLAESRRFVEGLGYEVVQEYREPGVSGAARLEERPAIQRMLADAGAGKFEAVVWLKFDRMSRSTLLGLSMMESLEKAGIKVLSVQEPLDSATPEGRLFRQQLLSFAEFERERIRERTVTGRRANAANGRWPGGAVPFGVDVDERGCLVENKEEAKAIRKATRMLIRGKTTGDVARAWNEAGLRSGMRGREWTHGMVRRLLRQDRLSSGVHNFWGHDLPHPVIIEPGVHKEVQAALNRSSEMRGAHGGRTNVYALSGRIKCPGPTCEGWMIGFAARGILYYRCNRRYTKQPCDSESIKLIRSRQVEDSAWAYLMLLLGGRDDAGEPDFELLREAFARRLGTDDPADELKSLRHRMTRAEEVIMRAEADHRMADTDWHARRLAGAVKRLEEDRSQLEQRIRDLQALADARAQQDVWLEAAARVTRLRRSTDPKVRRRVFDELDVKIDLVPPVDWPGSRDVPYVARVSGRLAALDKVAVALENHSTG